MFGLFFFFSSRRRHTRYWRDWSSDVCSSDLSHTSGLCQPPVHAIAVQRIWATARSKGELHVLRARRFLHANYPRLFAWHRYLATARDPEGSGLVTDRKSTRLNSSHANISYAVFCLKKK